MSLSIIDAGLFRHWLTTSLQSFSTGDGNEVACGDCRGCCRSSYFIHLRPGDLAAKKSIPKNFLIDSPGSGAGHQVMGYRDDGSCPMLNKGNCSIYTDRPKTCREYDCRIFSAAGILAGGKEKAEINHRIKQWQFAYEDETAKRQHEAVRRAADFISHERSAFPQQKAPTHAGEIAILAMKVHHLFMSKIDFLKMSKAEVALAIIQASREFDTRLG